MSYEGYPISDVVLPTRLMRLMGAEILLLTNAAGGGGTAGFPCIPTVPFFLVLYSYFFTFRFKLK